MAQVEASAEVGCSLAEAWEVYFDPGRWPAWVDGFATVVSAEGYPEVGGKLLWRSTPAGRGTVAETVVAHEPRRLHRVEFADPESSGTLETRFEMLPGGDVEPRTRVTQALDYSLQEGGPLRALTDFLFIRSQMKRSLQRSLDGLRAEVGHRDRHGVTE